jgi:RNA polymerase sigma-70 factor (ECF subfamily)
MDERDLAQRAADGDQEAFGELVRRHQAGVYNAAYRMLGNRQDAEDATQEAFLRGFRAIHSLDLSRSPGPWFRKIAINVCLNRLEQRETLELNEDEAIPDPSGAASRSSLPETQTIDRERDLQIRSALLALPPRYRAAIELRHFQELSYAEMAETLGCPLSDVKSDLFRARRLLAERLKERLWTI